MQDGGGLLTDRLLDVPEDFDKTPRPLCNEFSYRFNRCGEQLQMFDGTVNQPLRGFRSWCGYLRMLLVAGNGQVEEQYR